VDYTITRFPRVLAVAVINWRRAAEEVQAASHPYGGRAIVWRYGPVFLTDRITE
jgi:hypothetical protein